VPTNKATLDAAVAEDKKTTADEMGKKEKQRRTRGEATPIERRRYHRC
jgi:hypothetical protein